MLLTEMNKSVVMSPSHIVFGVDPIGVSITVS